jgi:hypothetical protein
MELQSSELNVLRANILDQESKAASLAQVA